MVPLGSLPLGAGVGDGARGLQRRRDGLGLLPARPCPLPRLPLGRGRHGRRQRRRPAPVHGARAVERPRPDPQGADVRPDRPAGQPRRGRQGVLVVPRRPPQPRVAAVALPLPAGRVPVRRPGRRERPPRPEPARVRAAGHRGVRRRPLLGGRRDARQGRPARPAHGGQRHQRRPGDVDAPRAAPPVVPQHLVVGRRRRAARAAGDRARPGRGGPPAVRRADLGARRRPGRRDARPAVLRQRHQPAPALRLARLPGVPEGRDQRPRRRRRRRR